MGIDLSQVKPQMITTTLLKGPDAIITIEWGYLISALFYYLSRY